MGLCGMGRTAQLKAGCSIADLGTRSWVVAPAVPLSALRILIDAGGLLGVVDGPRCASLDRHCGCLSDTPVGRSLSWRWWCCHTGGVTSRGRLSADGLTVSAESSSVKAARQFVDQRLSEAGLPADVVETAVLLTSELVTNAVLHAGTDIKVRVSVASGALIDVRDHSQQLPVPRGHEDDAVAGRGLELVELLADSFGVVSIPRGGKSVWFVVGDPDGPVVSDSWPVAEPRSGGQVVVLRQLPVVLYEVMREHHEALLREHTMQILDGPGPHAAVLTEVAAAERARLTVAAAVAAWRDTVADADLPAHVDLRLDVSAADAAGFAQLPAVISRAEEQAAAGQLLTLPALPEIAALREWLTGQILTQLNDLPPTAWKFTDDAATPQGKPVDVDTGWVNSTEQAVIVGDDTNRIIAISAMAAELLGWDPALLVGKRLTAIIPPRLREAHVAGFTRQLFTARRRLLDQPIQLPALRNNGSEVTVTVTLTRHTVDDRVFFCAWLTA